MTERPRTSTRDFHTLHDGLEAWLGARSPGARISDLTIPESTGMSSETVVFDVHAPDGPPVPCVARMAPDQQAVPVFPSYDLPAQARAMELVGSHTDVPVPPVLWREESPEPLGSPFFVMARIDGVVPPDLPPYTFGGNWLSDAPAEHRHRVEEGAVGVLAGIHSIDSALVPDDFWPAPGRDPTEQLRRHLAGQGLYYEWARDTGFASPLVERTLVWLEGHVPTTTEAPTLSWGDARLGNILFHDFSPVAVLDWEMVAAGPRELDLGWLIMQHRFFQDLATTFDLPGLPDFLTRQFVVDRYERLTGYQARDLDWFILYASMRFAIIYLRVAQRQLAFGELEMPDDPDDVLLHRAQLEAMLAGTYW